MSHWLEADAFTGETVLVTGAGGFIGGGVARALVRRCRGACHKRGDYPELAAAGITCHRGDLAKASEVNDAITSSVCTAIVHVAAKAGVWGPYDDYHHANVAGTRNILAAIAEKNKRHESANIRALVFTSSPSVVFDGTDEVGIVALSAQASGRLFTLEAVAEQAVLRHQFLVCESMLCDS